jgi:hypothetical protein
MWLCFNDGFLSVVNDKKDPTKLVVRARRKQALLAVCGEDVEVSESAGSDYRWRTFVDRKSFSELVATRIEKIDYSNFKNSVIDDDLHELYIEFWSLHRRYQQKDEAIRSLHGHHVKVPRKGNSDESGRCKE